MYNIELYDTILYYMIFYYINNLIKSYLYMKLYHIIQCMLKQINIVSYDPIFDIVSYDNISYNMILYYMIYICFT